MGKGLAACFILACICLWGLCSCSAEKNGTFNEYADFKDKAELKADRIEVPPVLLYPRSVYLLNDRLVVLNEKLTLYSLYIICRSVVIGASSGRKDRDLEISICLWFMLSVRRMIVLVFSTPTV